MSNHNRHTGRPLRAWRPKLALTLALLTSAVLGTTVALAAGAGAAPTTAVTASEAANIGAVARPPASETGPVRNQIEQAGEEITTLRYWRIRKGTFPEFLAASREGVWPYFEKIGARVIGMWQVITPPGSDAPDTDYDEVYLATRYASLAHWQATRDPAAMGGDGPDYAALRAALDLRDSLTLETRLTVLQGFVGPVGPMFLPGTGERFVPAP